MKHLSEEQMIDMITGEDTSPELREHLELCDACRDEVALLRNGFEAVKSVKPRMPLAPVPVISYERFNRHKSFVKKAWIAAAAMLLISLMGLRVEIGGNGLVVQLAIFQGQSDSQAQEQRLAAVEARLLDALEAHSSRTQDQMDARFNAFYMDRDQELGEFSQVVNRNLTNAELSHEQKLLLLEASLLQQAKEKSARSQLR